MVLNFHHVDFFKEAASAANERCRKLCLDVPSEEIMDGRTTSRPENHQRGEELRDALSYSCEMREFPCEMQDLVAPGLATRVIQGLLPRPMSTETLDRNKRQAATSAGESPSDFMSCKNSLQTELEAPVIDEQVYERDAGIVDEFWKLQYLSDSEACTGGFADSLPRGFLPSPIKLSDVDSTLEHTRLSSLASAMCGSPVATEDREVSEMGRKDIASIDCCILEDVEHALLHGTASLVKTKALLRECQPVMIASEVTVDLGVGLNMAAELLSPGTLVPSCSSTFATADIFDTSTMASSRSKQSSQVGEIGETLDDPKHELQPHQLSHLPFLEEPSFISISALATLTSAEILSSAVSAPCESLSEGVLAPEVTFASLVVARELLLQFGRFRGLPVPVIANCSGGLPLEHVPQPSFHAMCSLVSPSGGRIPESRDVLYLDWHYVQSVDTCSAPGCVGLRRLMELDARPQHQLQQQDLPLRSIVDALDVGVDWNEEQREPSTEECLQLERGMSAPSSASPRVSIRCEKGGHAGEAVRTVQGLEQPESCSAAVNPEPPVKQMREIGQKMPVLKMSDELSFFKSCQAPAAGQKANEQAAGAAGDMEERMTEGGRETGGATAVHDGNCASPSLDPTAAEHAAHGAAYPVPDKPNSGRIFHDVEPTEQQLVIVEAARREYSAIAWRVRQKCAFPLRPFSLSPEDGRMLQEYMEVVREERIRGAVKAGSCSVAAAGGAGMQGSSSEADSSLELDLLLLSLLQQTAQQCWHYGMCVAHLALEYRWEAMQQQQSTAASMGERSAGVHASAMSSSAALHSLRQQLLQQYDRVQAGDAMDHPKLPLLTSIMSAHKAMTESQSHVEPSSQARQPPSCRPILLVTESMAFVPLYCVLADAGVRPVAVDRCASLLVDGRLPASHVGAVTHMVTQALEASSADCVMVSPRYLVPGFPFHRFSLLLCFTDDIVPMPLLPSGATHVLRMSSATTGLTAQLESQPSTSDDELDKRVEGEAVQAAAAVAKAAAEAAAIAGHMSGDEVAGDEHEPQPVVQPPHPRCFSDGPPVAPPVLLVDPYEAGGRMDGPTAPHVSAGVEGGLGAQPFPMEQAGHDGTGAREGRQEEEKKGYIHCIVVNTREQHSPVFMQRRELYEQVLRLEACGVQVLERDLLAPVDLILSPSSCLVIITQHSLLSFCSDQRATMPAASNSAASRAAATAASFSAPSPSLSLPLPDGQLLLQCVAGVAETTLRAISFAFDACIMVFEASPHLTSHLCDHSASLYAAGLALGLHLQCIFSTSQEDTASTVLALIRQHSGTHSSTAKQPCASDQQQQQQLPVGMKDNQVAYHTSAQRRQQHPPFPRAPGAPSLPISPSPAPCPGAPSPSLPFLPLPEFESPHESFLCRFPSLNPLTAHVILHTGMPLPVFLCLPLDHQAALTCPHLPFHSLMLFAAQCQSVGDSEGGDTSVDERQQHEGREASAAAFSMMQQQAGMGTGRFAVDGTRYPGNGVLDPGDCSFNNHVYDPHLLHDHRSGRSVGNTGQQWASREEEQLGDGMAAVHGGEYCSAAVPAGEVGGESEQYDYDGECASRRGRQYLRGHWEPMSQQAGGCSTAAAAAASHPMRGLLAQQAEAHALSHQLPRLKRLRMTATGAAAPANRPFLMAERAGMPSCRLSPPLRPASPQVSVAAGHAYPAAYSPSMLPACAAGAVSETAGWEEMVMGGASPVYPMQVDSPPYPVSTGNAAENAVYNAGAATCPHAVLGDEYAQHPRAGGGVAGRMVFEEEEGEGGGQGLAGMLLSPHPPTRQWSFPPASRLLEEEEDKGGGEGGERREEGHGGCYGWQGRVHGRQGDEGEIGGRVGRASVLDRELEEDNEDGEWEGTHVDLAHGLMETQGAKSRMGRGGGDVGGRFASAAAGPHLSDEMPLGGQCWAADSQLGSGMQGDEALGGRESQEPGLPRAVAGMDSSIGQALSQWWQKRRQQAAETHSHPPAAAQPHSLARPACHLQSHSGSPGRRGKKRERENEEAVPASSGGSGSSSGRMRGSSSSSRGGGRGVGGVTGKGERAGRAELPGWLLQGLGRRTRGRDGDRDGGDDHSHEDGGKQACRTGSRQTGSASVGGGGSRSSGLAGRDSRLGVQLEGRHSSSHCAPISKAQVGGDWLDTDDSGDPQCGVDAPRSTVLLAEAQGGLLSATTANAAAGAAAKPRRRKAADLMGGHTGAVPAAALHVLPPASASPDPFNAFSHVAAKAVGAPLGGQGKSKGGRNGWRQRLGDQRLWDEEGGQQQQQQRIDRRSFGSDINGAAALSPAGRRTARQRARVGGAVVQETEALDSLLAADSTAAVLPFYHASNSNSSYGSKTGMRATRQAAAVSAAAAPLSPGASAHTPVRSSSASYAAAAAARLGSYTPMDKRAKEVLSFERSGSDRKQCKLVWKKWK